MGAFSCKFYSAASKLTAEGRELCTRLFKRFANLISIAIEPSLEVCAHCGCKVYEGGHREVIEGKETTFCCKHCANSYKKEKKLHGKPLKKRNSRKSIILS